MLSTSVDVHPQVPLKFYSDRNILKPVFVDRIKSRNQSLSSLASIATRASEKIPDDKQKSVFFKPKLSSKKYLAKSLVEQNFVHQEVIIKNLKVDKNYLDLLAPSYHRELSGLLNHTYTDNHNDQQGFNSNPSAYFGVERGLSLSKKKLNDLSRNGFESPNRKMDTSKIMRSDITRFDEGTSGEGDFSHIRSNNFNTHARMGQEILPFYQGNSQNKSKHPIFFYPPQKELEYLSNSVKHKKQVSMFDGSFSVNPFLPSINQGNISDKANKIMPRNRNLSRRSSGTKDDSLADGLLSSQHQLDLFNMVVTSSNCIKIPSNMSPSNMNVGGNKMKSSRFLITTTNISIPPIENEDRSATTIKKGKDVEVKPPAEVSKASMLDNYSSSELRENILGSLKESLMKTIKSSEELNTKKEGYEVKVLGYQMRKEQFTSSKGQDRLASFADYLGRFAGYVLDLVFCDIPKKSTLNKHLGFEISLSSNVMEGVLPTILQKVKEFGMSDIMARFESVFRAEFLNIMVNAPIAEQFRVADCMNAVVEDLLQRINTQYGNHFNQYFSTCQYFLTDLVTDGSKQKIKDYMSFIRMHLKRTTMPDGGNATGRGSISYPNNVIPSDTNGTPTHAKASQFSVRQSIIGNSILDGIVENPSYTNNLRVQKEDLFFVKKSLYDVLKRQVPNLSLTNRAKILEKIELLRFGYFKEVYVLDEGTNTRLINIMRSQVESSPPLMKYFKRPESTKQITKLLGYLLDSIIGDSPLQSFLDKSASILTTDLDFSLLSMLEQGVKGSLSQMQINPALLKEIEHKFIHLRRRARLTPPFNATFYQIDQIVQFMNNWISLMEQHKQFRSDKGSEDIIREIKQVDFLEYFLVCALSDYDTFSIDDLACGLKLYNISAAAFQFWLRGIKRIFAKMKLKQKEINLIEDYFQKAYFEAS